MGPDTEKLRDPYRDSRQRGILKSRREHDRRHERPDAYAVQTSKFKLQQNYRIVTHQMRFASSRCTKTPLRPRRAQLRELNDAPHIIHFVVQGIHSLIQSRSRRNVHLITYKLRHEYYRVKPRCITHPSLAFFPSPSNDSTDTSFYTNQALLRSATCHIKSHSVACHRTQVNAPRIDHNQAGRTRFTHPGGMEG